MKFKAPKMEESTYMSFDSLDIDSIILPSMPSRTPSDLFEWSKNDEILLDPDDRPLELAVNANSPLTFNIVAGSDRTAEVLRNLQSGSFTPLQRKKLMERFNIDEDTVSSSDFGGHRTSQSSASESTGKCDSLEGSPITSDRNRNGKMSSLPAAKSFSKPSDSPLKPPSSLKELEHLQNGKEKNKKTEKLSQLLNVGTLPRQQNVNSKPNTKASKRSQTVVHRRGREQTVSASARKLFLSLRKTGRGRSASRDRAEKQSPAKPSVPSPKATQDELSSDVHLPGILKIFGDAVSPGANYKSVLATRQSNARELVKAALERYGVPRSRGKKYVLCEVVGRLREDKPRKAKENAKDGKVEYSVLVSHQTTENDPKRDLLDERFTEDYVRPLNDHEKPLILQSFWKPLEGYSRRFELRRRSQVLDQINNEKDTETKDVNAQAKRLILAKTRLSRTQSSLSIKMPQPECSSSDDEDEEAGKESEGQSSPAKGNNVASDTTLPTPSEFADNAKSAESNGDVLPVPFLITLQGEEGVKSGPGNEKGGNLVHYLGTKVTVIGKQQEESAVHGEQISEPMKDVHLRLSAKDIKSHHCVIYRRQRSGKIDSDESPWIVTLHPVSEDCVVTVNGLTVSSDKEIFNGDIIAVGAKYLFMLKDPSSKTNLTSSMRFGSGSALNSNVNRLNSIASRGSAFTPVKKRFVESEINYRVDFEDHVLDVIFAAANDIVSSSSSREQSKSCHRELAPARFLCHCIEQACFNFTLEQKRSLLFVIATNLQTILLDATGCVSVQDDAKIKNPAEGINYILPKLEAVVFWMSNSLEIFSYLQTDLVERIKVRVSKELELNEVDSNLLNEASSFRVSDDILAVLEEVVMYAFQQLVYYLTKTLYGALPKVLDTNPFAEVDDLPEGAVRGTGHVIAIYDAAMGLTRKYGVHPAIESQLFAYLFFFTNVSLFNTLMEDESAQKYYRWDKGVQIRGNLEEIECWANDNGFQDQATEFLLKFSTLTNLLATTKNQMLQSTWSNFRRDFPQLHPVQLRQILDGYVLGPRVKKRPSDWIPDSVDLEESTDEDQILESYDNHPPLMLPTDGTQLNLNERPDEPWYSALRDVVLAVGQGVELGNIKPQDSWLNNKNNNNESYGEREQPDGREIPSAQLHAHSSLSSSSASSMTDKSHITITHDRNNQSRSLTHSDIMEAVKLSQRPTSSSTTSLSSAVSDSTSHASLPQEYYASAANLMSAKDIHSVPANGQVVSPIPAPRKLVTPTPSPRHHKPSEAGHKSDTASDTGSTSASITSTVSGNKSPKKSRSIKRSNNKRSTDLSIRDFRSDPSLAINSLLLNEHNEQHGERELFVDDPSASFASDVGSHTSSTDSYVDVHNIGSRRKRKDDLRVLPVKSTPSKQSEIANNEEKQATTSPSSEGTMEVPQTLPNEVFIVDVVKGHKGLGLGLVDGMYTSLHVPGVFVRSLVPDGPSVKHVRMKHQEVIKCWLQDGRLQLGDRLLAVNGTSLISMNYASAMNELRQSGDQMRFLVGRSGPEVAMKITSSSC